jgi:pimeloyl-ACP methyl ester carboxylesterase
VPQVRALRETVYGVKTRYLEAGAGEPVVLLHGGGAGASAEMSWRNLIPRLAERFHVYGLDMIGFGYTDKPLVEYSFQTQVDHLAGFVDVLNLDGVRVVGSSQGTYIAMKYALDYPARVKQAAAMSAMGTLSGAAGVRASTTSARIPYFDGTRESVRKLMEAVTTDPAEITEEMLDARYALASQPGHREAMDSFSAYRRLLSADASERQVYDIRHRLPQLQVPWCMLWGAEDGTAPLDTCGEAMRALVPDVPVHVIQGSGEHIALEQPDECHRLLLEFFGATHPAPVGR